MKHALGERHQLTCRREAHHDHVNDCQKPCDEYRARTLWSPIRFQCPIKVIGGHRLGNFQERSVSKHYPKICFKWKLNWNIGGSYSYFFCYRLELLQQLVWLRLWILDSQKLLDPQVAASSLSAHDSSYSWGTREHWCWQLQHNSVWLPTEYYEVNKVLRIHNSTPLCLALLGGSHHR